MPLRDRCPDEHGAVAVRHIPADGAEAPAQGVAAALVFGTLGLDGLQRACHSGNGGFLLRDELAEIDLGAQLLACGNHIAAAHQKADARAGHVEALAQGEELDCAGLGAGNVEDAVAHGTIKDDIAVGVIMDEQNLMCIAEIHDLLVQLRAAHAAHRVGRQGYDHHLGLIGHIVGDLLHIGQEVMLFGQVVVVRHAAAQLDTGNEHRVAGVRQQHHIAVVQQGKAHVAHAVLAAVKAHDLVRGNAVHIKAALVISAHGIQQFRQVPQGILPVFAHHGGIAQCLLDVRHRLKVRGTDRKIVQLFALCFQGHLFIIQGGKNFRAEQVQPF